MKTISDNVLNATAVIVTACVTAIRGYLFFAHVGQRWVYGVPVAIMAVACAGSTEWRAERKRRSTIWSVAAELRRRAPPPSRNSERNFSRFFSTRGTEVSRSAAT